MVDCLFVCLFVCSFIQFPARITACKNTIIKVCMIAIRSNCIKFFLAWNLAVKEVLLGRAKSHYFGSPVGTLWALKFGKMRVLSGTVAPDLHNHPGRSCGCTMHKPGVLQSLRMQGSNLSELLFALAHLSEFNYWEGSNFSDFFCFLKWPFLTLKCQIFWKKL